ncbi:hypothetical protein FNF27_06895 [Cafeteria roenbergensis]|uniref:WDHD1/CFT4 second beta-propeller domain-containing protein n=1 Tax=Cafeteria roenbergensis TaxID=33653 RepID=A0A5A8DYE1_CAFRO|nr:hypothetical protein FNF27_06895 [Cafeteria roenbergensis]
MSSRIRVEGTAVVFPDARSDVVFVKHRVLVAGTRADKGSLCLLTQTDKGEEDIFAGPDKETDAVARVCVVDCPEGASVVGVAGDELLKFALPGLERKAELFRGTLKLRAVSARPGSRWVACGGDDGEVAVLDALSGEGAVFRLAGFERNIKDVAFSPDGRLLAAVSADGSVRVWDAAPLDAAPPAAPRPLGSAHGAAAVDTGDPDLAPGAERAATPCRMAWAADSSALLVPHGAAVKAVAVDLAPPPPLPASSSSSSSAAAGAAGGATLTVRDIGLPCADVVVGVAVSPSGRYAACAELGYRVAVYDLGDRPHSLVRGVVGGRAGSAAAAGGAAPKRVAVVESDSEVTAMAWSPSSPELAVVDEDGRLSRCHPVQESLPQPHEAPSPAQPSASKSAAAAGRGAVSTAAQSVSSSSSISNGSDGAAAVEAGRDADAATASDAHSGNDDSNNDDDDDDDDAAMLAALEAVESPAATRGEAAAAGAARRAEPSSRTAGRTAPDSPPAPVSALGQLFAQAGADSDDDEGDDDAGGAKPFVEGEAAEADGRHADDEEEEEEEDDDSQGGEDDGRGEDLDDVGAIKGRLGFNEDGEPLDEEELEAMRRARRDPLAAAARVIKEQRQRERQREAAKQDGGDSALGLAAAGAVGGAVQAQPVLQPGASLPTHRDPRRRFLCWNRVGAVTSRDDDSHRTVEIELDDSSLASGKGRGTTVRLTDTEGFTMAALSEEGAVLAAPAPAAAPGDGGAGARRGGRGAAEGSLVTWQPLRGWTEGGRARWDMRLPAGEEARVVAAGREWLAVATSRRQLRVFRTSGVQEAVFLLPGAVVSMVGRGALLMVVTASGPPTAQGQTLEWQLWVCGDARASGLGSAAGVGSGAPGACASVGLGGLGGRGGVGPAGMPGVALGMGSVPRVVAAGVLPQRPGEQLTWAGFTEEGLAVVADSGGLLSALSPGAGWAWTVLADLHADGVTDEGKGQRAWVVDVSSGRVVYALVRSASKGPAVLPRPVLSTHSLRAPLCGPRPDAESARRRAKAASSAATAQSSVAGPDAGGLPAPAWAAEAEMLVSRVRADALRWSTSAGIPVDVTPGPAGSREDGSVDAPGGDVSLIGASAVGLAAARARGKQLLAAERSLDKAVLRLVHAAITRGAQGGAGLRSAGAADARALHMASRIVLPKSLDVAVQLAQQAGRAALAERLHSLRRARAAEREAVVGTAEAQERVTQATKSADRAVEEAAASAATAEASKRDIAARSRAMEERVARACDDAVRAAEDAADRAAAAARGASRRLMAHARAGSDSATPSPPARKQAAKRARSDSVSDQDAALGAAAGGGVPPRQADEAGTAADSDDDADDDVAAATGVAGTPPTVGVRGKSKHRGAVPERSAKRVAFAHPASPQRPSTPPPAAAAAKRRNPFARAGPQSPGRKPRDAFASLVAPSPDRSRRSGAAALASPGRLTRESTVSREGRGQRTKALANLN